mmetsp:Transcript_57952/g.164242  ORF Transcript_57952/g.164242 Transcript_57952/m.164242 type:complete len:225 (-) Transcript_57952:36-710(-)
MACDGSHIEHHVSKHASWKAIQLRVRLIARITLTACEYRTNLSPCFGKCGLKPVLGGIMTGILELMQFVHRPPATLDKILDFVSLATLLNSLQMCHDKLRDVGDERAHPVVGIDVNIPLAILIIRQLLVHLPHHFLNLRQHFVNWQVGRERSHVVPHCRMCDTELLDQCKQFLGGAAQCSRCWHLGRRLPQPLRRRRWRRHSSVARGTLRRHRPHVRTREAFGT